MKTENPISKNESDQNQQEMEELRRGPWTLEEDTSLIHYIHCHGEGRWNLLAKSAGKLHYYYYRFWFLCYRLCLTLLSTIN